MADLFYFVGSQRGLRRSDLRMEHIWGDEITG
jgi:hypothetical protein